MIEDDGAKLNQKASPVCVRLNNDRAAGFMTQILPIVLSGRNAYCWTGLPRAPISFGRRLPPVLTAALLPIFRVSFA